VYVRSEEHEKGAVLPKPNDRQGERKDVMVGGVGGVTEHVQDGSKTQG